MGKFGYNKIQNIITNYILFNLSCCQYLDNFLEKKIDLCLKLNFVNNLMNEFVKLITISQQNLFLH